MEDMITKRNQLRAQQLIQALKQRNMDASYAATRKEALEQALAWIPQGSRIGWGGSVSIDAIGLKDAVRQGDYQVIDRDTAATPEEKDAMMHEILADCDYFLTSTNALSQDGVLVNIDGTANRLAAMCYGPRHVLYIVGMNKVVATAEDALRRARNEAAPTNAMRFDLKTPCSKTGCCYDCKSPDTICCQILFTRYNHVPGRVKVILVEDSLGYCFGEMLAFSRKKPRYEIPWFFFRFVPVDGVVSAVFPAASAPVWLDPL